MYFFYNTTLTKLDIASWMECRIRKCATTPNNTVQQPKIIFCQISLKMMMAMIYNILLLVSAACALTYTRDGNCTVGSSLVVFSLMTH